MSAAFFSDILDPRTQAKAEYVKGYDFLGVDCYTGSGVLPAVPYAPGVSYPHPLLPWHDFDLATLAAAKEQTLAPYAAAAAWSGLKIVCTEVGWQSRPWSYGSYSSTFVLDADDGSVPEQCVSTAAQALAYEAFLDTFSAQEW